jgi:hypothetical protein
MQSSNDNHAVAPEAELEPVRFSRLKLMGKSPAHFAEGYGAETGSMRKGTALHAFLLGGESRVSVYTGGRRDERIGKWREFQAEHDGHHILIPSELESVAGMRESVERHARALALLDGTQEERIDWTDLGRPCRGTPDVVHWKNGRKTAVELKTCVTSHPERFAWQARKLAYHAQCAWYKRGLELTPSYGPGPVEEFFVVAVESTAPYPVTVFRLDQESLEAGAKLNRLWLEQLLVCERTGHFPAYAESDVLLSVVETELALDWEAA